MDIAIIGIGCRFPGGADSPAAFWRVLSEGVDAVTKLPPDRFDLDELFDTDPDAPGKIYTRWGGFLERVDAFDADFFGIAPREARRMDPQQRILLEVVWEALEDGGQVPERLAGTSTGVFVGISTHDYVDIQVLPQNRHRIDAHVNAGTAACIAANRVSYLLDLRGPSFTVDTACSSSLTAVHLACRSLASSECDVAIAGGVGVLLAPEVTMGFCKASMLSPNGRCRAFDASADGYVRSEGTGVIILKPLTQALADGDPVHAVVRGSAVNQDGRTTGMSLPSAAAQGDMLRQALCNAGVAPTEIQYVEAHGTGTPAGDPVEAEAIGRVLTAGRAAGVPCLLGSVKTNLGHLEAAAGMAGLIKAALALEHRQIPPNLHFCEPNPAIPFDELGLRVPTELEPWPATSGQALAGVNSFGFGGANAHVVLVAPPTQNFQPQADDDHRAKVLTISARSPEALRELASRYREHLRAAHEESLYGLCYTAAVRRSHHSERLAIVARSRAESIASLDAFLGGEERAGAASGHALKGDAPRLAFVFPGMGPQWWGMGRQLLEEEPVFRHTLEEVDATLQPLAGWSLLKELCRDAETSRVGDADVAHVANFAVQLALAALWRSWGIVPDVVVGHSSGEMAAACVSGALTLPDAVLLAFHRGRLQHRTTGTGRMLAAAISPGEAMRAIALDEHAVSLAAVNAPESVTLSGTGDALERIAETLTAQQRFARFLPVQVPYHGPQMEAIREEFLHVLHELRPGRSSIPFVSATAGDSINGVDLDAAYWWRNVRQPVLFAAATDRLIAEDCELFVEVGPHPVLAPPISENLAEHGRTATVLPTLRREEDERQVMLQSLAHLHVRGRPVDWRSLYPDGRCVVLPSYPWQRERHWYDSGEEPTPRKRRTTGVDTGHPLLGHRLPSAQPTWEVTLDRRETGYLDAHVIHGTVLFPGAGYLEMAMAAGQELWGDVSVRIEDIQFRKLLFLNQPGQDVVQLHYHPRDSVVEIYGNPTDDGTSWTLHTSARLTPHAETSTTPPDLQALRERCTTQFPVAEHYGFLERRSYRFGDAFRTLQEIWLSPDGALARIAFPPGVDLSVEGYRVHPALLDGTIQLFGALGTRIAAETQPDAAFFPVSIRRLTFRRPLGARFWAHVVIRHDNETHVDDMEGDAWLMDEDGELAVSMEGLRLRVLEDDQPAGETGMDDWLYELRWEEAPISNTATSGTHRLRPAPDIGAAVAASSDPPESTADVARYLDTVEPWVDRVTEGFTLAALEAMGWSPDRDRDLPAETVAESLGVVPRHRRLFAALLDMPQKLEKEDGDALQAVPRDHATLDGLLNELIAAEPQYAAEAELLRRGGTHLAAILRGEMDARDVLLTEDSLDLLARFYTTSPPCRTYHQLLADAVAAAIERADESAPLRVLEIGAGTGAATASILPLLPASVEYAFTDVSPYFLEEARTRFADRAGLRFAILDIEAEPATQGFEPHSFDLVIAANVLHVTEDLHTTLDNVQRLLAANGVLALLELTRRSRWLNLVFGLLDGWWRYTDVHLRAGGPMLGSGQWQELLAASGFEAVTAMLADAVDDRTLQTVLLAHAPATTQTERPAPQPEMRRHWLVFADEGSAARSTIEALHRRGDRCTQVRPGREYRRLEDGRFDVPPLDNEALIRLLGDVGPEDVHGVLHMWSLQGPQNDDTDAAELMDAQRLGCGSVLALMQALHETETSVPELCLITAGTQPVDGHDAAPHIAHSTLWGVGRVLMSEHDASRCRLIDLGPSTSNEEAEALAAELTDTDGEEEVALRGRTRFVRRLRRVSLGEHRRPNEVRRLSPDTDPFRLEVGAPGTIDSLLLRETSLPDPGPGEIAIRVFASGVNFRDVLQTLDMLPPAAYQYDPDPQGLGIECAGVVVACGPGVERFRAGDEVMTLAAAAHGSRVVAREHLTVAKPARLSFEQAASVLNGFVTAEYALHHVARITAGERILIHSATGAVGLAAIQLCRRAGVEIFATAGTPEKRVYLRELGIEHVMDSRSLAFADEVLRNTGGEGVDVVLNALSGEATLKGLAILRPYGRFIELGKRDIFDNAQLGLLPFQRNLSFHAVDLIPLALDRPALATHLLEHVVRQIDDDILQVVPTTAFDIARAEQGVRLMAQARHIGKVVLTIEEPEYPVSVRAEAPLVHADGTYLITGGLGGFGLTVAEWLGHQGAGSIVLMSRSGIPQDNQAALDALRASPAQVTVFQGDVSEETDVQRVLDRIHRELPPLKGVIHAAMVLDDDVFVHLDQQRFNRVLAPKIAGAWNLHRLTQADVLDFFVLFSSVAAVLGHPMQGNYAAANAFLDALAAHRQARGRPALTIAWGALADVGYVSRHDELAQYLERGGFQPFTAAQALETLDQLLRHDFRHVVAAGMDWNKWTQLNPLAALSRRFQELIVVDSPAPGEPANDAPDSPLALLRDAAPPDRPRILTDYLVHKVARVLGTTPQRVDPARPFTELGFDSLMAVELGTALKVDLGVKVPVVAILQGTSGAELAARLLEQLALDETGSAEPTEPQGSPPRPPSVEDDLEYPLSFEQQRFWFLDRLNPGTAAYNIAVATRMRGALDADALERSLSEVLRRHELLRAVIRDIDGTPMQRFAPPQPAMLPQVDLRTLPEMERSDALGRLATEEIQRPFDLSQGPLMRATLFRLGDEEHVFLLIVHHIASDAWAMNMLVGEIAGLYEAFSRGQQSPLAPPPLRYLDHVHRQAEIDEEVINDQLAYWQRQLAGAPAALWLPLADRSLSSVAEPRGGHQRFELSAELTRALRTLSRREGTTLFMTLLAAFQTLLYRYSGDEDICVGTAVSTRARPGTEAVAGCFMNTLVLRSDLSGEPTFREFLQRVRQTTLDAFKHQDVPYDRVVNATRPGRSPVDAPLFQAMLVLHTARPPVLSVAGLELEPVEVESGTAVTDLMLLLDDGERVGGLLEYNADRFDVTAIGYMLAHFDTLLAEIVAAPERPLSALPLMSAAERHQVLHEWNDTAIDFGGPHCLHHLVERQAKKKPHAVAVVCDGVRLSYQALDCHANQLAHRLQTLGVGPDVLVAVCMQRSPEVVVTALAVLKAGGAYLPLPPEQPVERLRTMLADAQAAVVITQPQLLDGLPAHDARCLALDPDFQAVAGESTDKPPDHVGPEHLAYVIYTSGSTGEPKGVMVPHRAVCNQLQWRQYAFPLSATDAVLQRTPLGFDPSVWELFGPLAAGARLVLPLPGTDSDGAALLRVIADQQVTTLQVVPSLLDALLEQASVDEHRSLRRVFCGGERLQPELQQRFFTRFSAELHHLYGPTEAAIETTHWPCTPGDEQPTVPIGRPIANTRVRILDQSCQPVPTGVAGELYIGGTGLARGYLNQPDQSAAAFIPDPFSNDPGERLYRTGDLGRWLPHGTIEHLGRVDDQVKVRGFRVEPAEVEAALTTHPTVHEAAVVPRNNGGDEPELAAFVVAADGTTPETLLRHAAERLPAPMVPATIHRLDRLPRLTSGKVDRSALARHRGPATDRPEVVTGPRDGTEEQLLAIWQAFFPGRPIGVTDDFFGIGGHSLLAMRMIARIQATFGRELPVSSLIQSRTIEQLARLLREQPEPRSPVLALQPRGSGQPFFCVHALSGTAFCYMELAAAMGEERPFYALEAPELRQAQPHAGVEAKARAHIKELKGIQPEGPYLLGGWSMGGVIAFEMARQLEAQGQSVAQLIVMDARPWGLAGDAGKVLSAPALNAFMHEIGLAPEDLDLSPEELGQLEPEQQLDRVLEQARRANRLLPEMKSRGVQSLLRIVTANMRAMGDYVPRHYPGRVTVLDAEESRASESSASPAWEDLAQGNVTRHLVPGDHYSMLHQPHVAMLAQRLTECLAERRQVAS